MCNHNTKRGLLFIGLLMLLLDTSNCWLLFGSSSQDLQEMQDKGKLLLATYTKQSSWSDCWRQAVQDMVQHCKELRTNEEMRSKLAIHLTNCHLSKSGLRMYDCLPKMTVEECTKDMVSSPIAFNTYTEFSTHVDQICFSIKMDSFHEESQQLVQHLVNETDKSVQEIRYLYDQSKTIQDMIRSSEIVQERILNEQTKFEKALQLMKKLELEFYESLRREFTSIQTLSKTLYQETRAISEEQVKSKEMIKDNFFKLEQSNTKLKNSLEQSLEQSERLRMDQSRILIEMGNINEKQHQMVDMTKDSLSYQEQLMHGQNILQQLQVNLTYITTNHFSIIEHQSYNIEKNIDNSIKNQNTLLEKQKESTNFLAQLKQEQLSMFEDAQKSLNTILVYNQETVNNIREQHEHVQEILNNVFDISHSYTVLIGEFMDIKSILYYSITIVLSFLLTSSNYTTVARLPLFGILTLNYVTEKILISLLWSHTDVVHINYWRGIWRSIFVILCLLVLCFSIWKHKDYSKLTFQMINDISLELQDIKRSHKNDYYYIKKGSSFRRSKNIYQYRYSNTQPAPMLTH